MTARHGRHRFFSKEAEAYRQQSDDDREDRCNGKGATCIGFKVFPDLDEEFVFLAAHCAPPSAHRIQLLLHHVQTHGFEQVGPMVTILTK